MTTTTFEVNEAFLGMSDVNIPTDNHERMESGDPTLTVGQSDKSGQFIWALGIFETNKTAGGDIRIPAHSVIQDAYLEVKSASTTATGDMDLRISAIPPDGRWHNPLSDFQTKDAESIRLVMTVSTASGIETVADTTSGATALGFVPIRESTGELTPIRLGQAIVPTATGVLNQITLQQQRIGGFPGAPGDNNIWIEVYDPVASDGTDDRPDIGSLLATSDFRNPNDISPAIGGALFDYDFTGANRIDIDPVGRRVVCVVAGDFALVPNPTIWTGYHGTDTANPPGTIQASGIYSEGKMSLKGAHLLFSEVNYVSNLDLPYPEITAGLIRAAPSGVVVEVTVPDFSINEVYEIGDISPVVQDWVNRTDYNNDVPLALAVGPGSTAIAGDLRVWNGQSSADQPWKLIVTYREPKNYITDED